MTAVAARTVTVMNACGVDVAAIAGLIATANMLTTSFVRRINYGTNA